MNIECIIINNDVCGVWCVCVFFFFFIRTYIITFSDVNCQISNRITSDESFADR